MRNDGDEVHGGEFGDRRREPAFNLPASLVFVLGVLTLIHLVRTYLLSASTDEFVLLHFGFIPGRYSIPLSEQDLGWLWSPVTYSLLHGGWEHLIFNAFWMVAFGAPVVRRIGRTRFFLFWCLSAIAAVAFHTALHWGAMILVVGASGVVSGLMGAAAERCAHRRAEIAGRVANSGNGWCTLALAGAGQCACHAGHHACHAIPDDQPRIRK